MESEIDNIVSKRDKLQDMIINQLKLKVQDTYIKDDEITTKFETVNDEDEINKAYLIEKISKTKGHLSTLEKDYNEYKLKYNKQSVKEILIQRGVRTTIQILSDKGFFKKYAIADKVLGDFLSVTRRRGDLEESK